MKPARQRASRGGPLDLREAEELLLDLELFGMRFGLDRMFKLTTTLGMPQRRFGSVHVVGTNGKSSTVRMIAAILEAHGLRTGSFTSPHLRSFAERIEVGGRAVTGERFAAAVGRAAHAASVVERTLPAGESVTQFELLTAAAFDELAHREVEVAVVEAGLGGRYDATNVIPSRVQLLTGVGLEHTRWLGPTLTDIAGEKLAVARDHATLVLPATLPPEVEEVAARVARERHSRVVRAAPESPHRLRALGAFQRRNFALAEAAAEAFLGRALDAGAVARAGAALEIPGRLERAGERPLTLLDGAHNPAGAEVLAESLPEVVGDRRLVLVISVLEDKDAAGVLGPLLPLAGHAVFTRCENPRALSPATLESLAGKLPGTPPFETVPDPRAALARARELARPEGAVLATGSIYLIADLVRSDPAARASSL